MSDTAGRFEHVPVMVAEVLEQFRSVPPGAILDATVGGGGHAAALLERYPHLSLLGLDQDLDAVEAARVALAFAGSRAVVVHRRFDLLAEAVEGAGVGPLSGVLFDLGVSSPQFDRGERGFSHRSDAPLDMRMNRSSARTAADIVNTYAEGELVGVLRRNADEPHAVRIARAIVRHRPLATTADLVEVVRAAVPAAARRKGGHPATRTFQALRIEVNGELEILPAAIDDAIAATAAGGRIVVLSYHSGEDRIVKDRFRLASTGGCRCPVALPCVCGAVPTVALRRRSALLPSDAEIAANPRAASARLRAATRLPYRVASRPPARND